MYSQHYFIPPSIVHSCDDRAGYAAALHDPQSSWRGKTKQLLHEILQQAVPGRLLLDLDVDTSRPCPARERGVWSTTSMAATTRATVPAETTSNDSGGGPSIRAASASRFCGSSARRSSAWRARSPSETEAARPASASAGKSCARPDRVPASTPSPPRPRAEPYPGERGQHAHGLRVVQSSDHVVHHGSCPRTYRKNLPHGGFTREEGIPFPPVPGSILARPLPAVSPDRDRVIASKCLSPYFTQIASCLAVPPICDGDVALHTCQVP